MTNPDPGSTPRRRRGPLDLIEWAGNKLPDPVFLFLGAAVLVVIVSAVGSALGWTVQPVRPEIVPGSADLGPVIRLVNDGAPIGPRSLLSRDGVYWAIANMIRNFINFPPLGVVLVGVLGIGLAERVGLFGAAMKWLAGLVPSRLLTPTVVLLGILSNIASDAGYIVLPPLAAALYATYRRSPVVGIAAAFSGIAAGFSANLMIASTDALMSELTQRAARVLDPRYEVIATCNWFFMAASTLLLTLAGWAVTAWLVEPRFRGRPESEGGPPHGAAGDAAVRALTPAEARGLRWAGAAVLVVAAGIVAAIALPGSPLSGPMPVAAPPYGEIPAAPAPAQGAVVLPEGADPAPGARVAESTITFGRGASAPAEAAAPDGSVIRGTFRPAEGQTAGGTFERVATLQGRWTQAIVPLVFIAFVVPGVVFGLATGQLRSQKDVAEAFVQSMRSMAPIIAIAFFAAQFIEYLKYSQLDRMIAFSGGVFLAGSGLPRELLIVGVVLLTMVVNMLMASMSAKWTMLAPVLVPMLMMVGVSPELTQAAYRVGDSVTNIVTPLNSYMLIILVVTQRHWKQAGMGTLIATMTPYSLTFAAVWTLFLVAWMGVGLPPGPGAGLVYPPAP